MNEEESAVLHQIMSLIKKEIVLEASNIFVFFCRLFPFASSSVSLSGHLELRCGRWKNSISTNVTLYFYIQTYQALNNVVTKNLRPVLRVMKVRN